MSQSSTTTTNLHPDFINAKLLTCVGGSSILGHPPAGSSTVTGGVSVGKGAIVYNTKKAPLQINSKMLNSDLCYATVTIPSSGSSAIISNVNVAPAAAPAATLNQHSVLTTTTGVKSGGGQVFHMIPFQIGNHVNHAVAPTPAMATTTTLPEVQTVGNVPLTIIAKTNEGALNKTSQQNAVNNCGTDVLAKISNKGQIMANTLPIINNHSIPKLMAANANVGLGTSGGLINARNATNLPTGLAVYNLQAPKTGINGPTTIVLQNQAAQKLTTAALRTIPVTNSITFPVLNSSHTLVSSANQFVINGNAAGSDVIGNTLTSALPIKPHHIEIQRMDLQTPLSSLKSITSIQISTILNDDETNPEITSTILPGPSEKENSVQKDFTTDQSPSLPAACSSDTQEDIIISLPLLSIDKVKTIPEIPDIQKTEGSNAEPKIIGEVVPTKNFGKSDTMLIIQDSSDEEESGKDGDEGNGDDEDSNGDVDYNEEDGGNDKPHIEDCNSDDEVNVFAYNKAEQQQEAPDKSLHVARISNSVVLTKASSSDGRGSGSSRNMSPEPANVVLMKLPNATQPNEKTNNRLQNLGIPINEALSEISKPKSILLSTPLGWSNSTQETRKELGQRAVKRSQSLNNNLLQTELQQSNAKKKKIFPDQRRFSIPAKISSITTTTVISSKTTETNIGDSKSSSNSSEELNKENNDITFIELDDDSLDEESIIKGTSDSCTISITKEDTTKPEKDDQNGDTNLAIIQISTETSSVESSTKDLNANLKALGLIPAPPKKPLNDENDDQIIKSLLCNEQITAITPSSSSSSIASSNIKDNFSEMSEGNGSKFPRSALAPRTREHNKSLPSDVHKTGKRLFRDNSLAAALSMVSTFDMLSWKDDRLATARGTGMRFELNEFNLLQLHERGCPPRHKIHTSYESPISERFSGFKHTDQADPLLYLCRRCKLYGPAVEFLAPEFCSVECLRRHSSGKRSAVRDSDVLDIKRQRKVPPKPVATTYNGPKTLPSFRWASYLNNMRNACAAPIDLFLNPFPTGPNPFAVGMKLEAIDPENCSLFCVCTVVKIQGYRLCLTFDGYDSIYDFWVNADSMDIFPVGWCARTNRILQPPRGIDPFKFDWHAYLRKTGGIAANKELFTHLNGPALSNRNPFKVGMFLEADDLNDTGKLCVASVVDVLDERIRVHFDGWDDCYDYWVDINSPYIHPCGWHEGRQQLLVPPEYGNTAFSWHEYIREMKMGIAVPNDFFSTRDPIDYRPGMKLEVVDPRNSSLIRPATVVHRSRHRVKIHIDGWSQEYTFSLEDDSPDLHPIGWCDATGHDLEPPLGYLQLPKIMPCSTLGCRGIGNIDRNKGRTHATRELCPYALENWRIKPEKTPRLEGKLIIRRSKLNSDFMPPAKRQSGNQISTVVEKPYASVSIKNVTRGRPRNCDRQGTAAAAAAVAAAERTQEKLRQQQQQQEHLNVKQRSNSFETKPIKTENGEITPKVSTPALSPIPKAPDDYALDSNVMIAKRFLCDYGPRLQQNYKIWRQNLTIDITSKVCRNPMLWTTAETCAFIDAVLNENDTNSRYAISSIFYKHDIDGSVLLMLQQQDMIDILQLKIGPAIKLCSIILQLRMLVVSNYKSADEVKTSDVNCKSSTSIDSELSCRK